MNMCIHGTIATGVETLRARVKHNMARGASEFCSELQWVALESAYTVTVVELMLYGRIKK